VGSGSAECGTILGVEEPTIVRLAELGARGATYREARGSVAHLTRLTRGAYADTTGLSAEQEHIVRARALLTRVSNVVASHTTAALTWGLPVRRSQLGQVHLSPRAGRPGGPKSGPGFRLHCRQVDESDALHISDLLVTSPVRTVLDCASMTSMDWAVAIGDAALHRGLIEGADLETAAAGVRRLKGAARMRALPSLCSGLAESPGESLLRMRLVRMGLAPVEQYSMPWIEGSPRVDFLIGDSLVVEFDGEGKYSLNGDPARAHWEEKLRHDRLVEAGNEVIHVVWAQLWDEAALRRRVDRARERSTQRAPIRDLGRTP
jgi:hypothetical protein